MAWNDLSIAQRSQLMNIMRHNGISSLSEMRRLYDLSTHSSSSLVENTFNMQPQAPIYKRGGKKTVRANKGESWISLANKYGVGLPDLLAWNGIDPESREALPTLHPQQEVYISNPYNISPAVVSADAPRDYVDYGERGRDLITNYARAIEQGALRFNQVPKEYQQAVYQRGITLKTDRAANNIFKTGLNTALFLTDPIGYTAGTLAQKGAAYANDAISGRNEYGLEDLVGYTPVMGREYAKENPMKAVAIDAATGILGGSAIRNAGTVAENARQAFQNAAATTGIQRQTLSFPQFSTTKGSFGHVYQDGVKGAGKTGSQYAGRASGYRPQISAKGTFNYSASGIPETARIVGYNTPVGTLPISPLPFNGALPPIGWITEEPSVGVKHNPMHIREEQTFSTWQNPYYRGKQAEYVPGTGLFTIKGNAPIGNSVNEQALTKETLSIAPDRYVPRKAVYVKGALSGTPSDIYSGLGITYDSEDPGSLIFGEQTHADGGHKIHIKKANRGKFTALKKRTGHSASWFKAHGTPTQKKMAVFALNARKWKHDHGGIKF